MPQVITDTTLNPGVINNMGSDLFSYPNVALPSVLGLQVPATQPLPAGTDSAPNLITPDLLVPAQLKNFPSNVYDTSPTSLLTHFMQALLGAAGGGQLRMRQLVARLQQAITSTRFYDLDGFYGALFGAQRGPGGTLPPNPNTGLPVNPYTDLASPDAWDEIEALDADYRERIIQLARAITLGGTVPGLQALAEAVTGVTCQVYEIWRLLDNAEGPIPGAQIWQQVTATYPTWGAIPSSQTWQGVEGVVSFTGLLGGQSPTEVVIQPRRSYSSSVADQVLQGSDTFGILSVVEVLKPAGVLVTVDTTGPQVTVPAAPSAAWSPSEYWEVIPIVTPPDVTVAAYQAIANSYQGTNAGELPAGSYITPVPPITRSQGAQYSYAGDVTTVTAAATEATTDGPVVIDGQDFQTVVFPGTGDRPVGPIRLTPVLSPAQTVQYLPSQAIMPPQHGATARTSSPVTVKSAPYSGPRTPVVRSS